MRSNISASALETFWRCGEAYRRRYVEREIIPPGFALMIGSSLHKGAEENFRQKIETHEDLPVDDIVEAAVAEFQSRTTGGDFVLTSEEESIGARKVIGAYTDLVADMADIHARVQAPDYQPIAVEVSTLIELPNASRDLLTVTDLRDDQGRVVDFKTALRKKSRSEVETSTALTAYAAAYRVDFGRDPSSVRLDTVLKPRLSTSSSSSTRKRKTTRDSDHRQVLEATRGEPHYLVLAERIDATVRAIEAGIFTPTSPTAWQCSQKWCGYARTCPFYTKRSEDEL